MEPVAADREGVGTGLRAGAIAVSATNVPSQIASRFIDASLSVAAMLRR
jgi:hypothetical protein